MLAILFSRRFVKSARRLRRSGKFKQKELDEALQLLAGGCLLPVKYRDHPLKGDLDGRRECHIRGDVLLVYRKDHDALLLIALDIGTHHELFGS